MTRKLCFHERGRVLLMMVIFFLKFVANNLRGNLRLIESTLSQILPILFGIVARQGIYGFALLAAT